LYKPEYTLTIESSGEPARYTVKWTARVNTGGWTMETDVARVENSMDKNEARIYVILTQPDPNDMVTQAFETLEGSFDAGETEVHKAELSVKHRAANDDPSFMRYYTVVKRAP